MDLTHAEARSKVTVYSDATESVWQRKIILYQRKAAHRTVIGVVDIKTTGVFTVRCHSFGSARFRAGYGGSFVRAMLVILQNLVPKQKMWMHSNRQKIGLYPHSHSG